MKAIFAGLLTASLVTPAFAVQDYYVVQDQASRKCFVVLHKPPITTMIVVGDTMYKTRAKAKAAMKAAKDCRA